MKWQVLEVLVVVSIAISPNPDATMCLHAYSLGLVSFDSLSNYLVQIGICKYIDQFIN